MSTVNGFIISSKGHVFFFIYLLADGTWSKNKARVKKKPNKRPKKGRMANLLRQHRKSLNR